MQRMRLLVVVEKGLRRKAMRGDDYCKEKKWVKKNKERMHFPRVIPPHVIPLVIPPHVILHLVCDPKPDPQCWGLHCRHGPRRNGPCPPFVCGESIGLGWGQQLGRGTYMEEGDGDR